MMEDEPQEPVDNGICLDDARRIKVALLQCVITMHPQVSEMYELAEDIMSAFKAIDNEAFVFAENERKTRAIVDKPAIADTIRSVRP